MQNNLALSTQLVTDLLNYIASKPYIEVFQLIDRLNQEIREGHQHDTVQPNPGTDSSAS